MGLSTREELATDVGIVTSLFCCLAINVSRNDLLYLGCGLGGIGTAFVLRNAAAGAGGVAGAAGTAVTSARPKRSCSTN